MKIDSWLTRIRQPIFLKEYEGNGKQDGMVYTFFSLAEMKLNLRT